jgi:fibronectin-binding autotransporter adhesin
MSRLHCFTVATRVWGRRRPRPGWTRIWLALLCGLGAAARPALAANGTWNSSAPFSQWILTNDWVSGIIPGATSGTTNTDTATFNTTSSSTSPFVDSNRNLENITFDTSAAAYTFNSGPFVLTSGGTIQLASTFTGSNITETFNTPLTLEGNYTFANNATNTGDVLTFGGAISSGVAGTQTLSVSCSDAVTINGAIGGGSGTIALSKGGNGTLTLGGSGDNTGLAVFVNGGGTVLLAKTSSASVHAVGSGGLTINGGAVQLSGSGGDQISDSATVTINNNGVFTLAGQNETIGGLSGTSSAAVVQNAAAAPAALTINSPNGFNNSFSGVLRDGAGGGALSLVKSGNGEQGLQGNDTFTAAVTINAGRLDIFSSGALNSTTPNAVAFGPGSTGTLALNGNSVSIGGLSGSSTSAVVLNGVSTAGTLTVIESGSDTFAGSVQDNLSLVKAGAGSLTLSGNNSFSGGLTINAGSLTLSGSNSFSGGVTINAGTLTLSGNNTFTGGVTINAGTLQIGNPGALNSASPNAVTDNGTLTLNGNSVTVASLNGSGIVQNASAANGTLTVAVSGGGNASFAGTLQDGSGGGKLSLVINGSVTGQQNLTGNNTFTGGVTVNGGVLAISGGSLAANVAINGGIFDQGIGQGGGSLLGDVTNSGTFLYESGTFGGRLIEAGGALDTATPLTLPKGLVNEGALTLAATFTLQGTTTITLPEATITLGGPGLDNEGTLTMAGGTLILSTSPSAANVNNGTLNLSAVISLGGATLTNDGTLNLNGGAINGASGSLINGVGGSISGTGVISSGFTNSGGIVTVGSGTMNITQPFTNNGIIQLTSFTANLVGGAITNNRTINGNGNIASAITNNGTIAPLGGNLYLSGTVSNPAAGLIRVSAGNEVLVTQGLPTNAGIINLIGGTFDNDGFALNNTGQISGSGIFATGGTGLDNHGSITFSGGLTTVNGPVTNENGQTIVVAYNPAIFTGLVTNNGGGTFNIVSTTAVFAGGSSGTFGGTFTNNANSAFSEGGSGTLEVDGAPTLGAASSLAVNDSSNLRFKATTGAATIGSGVVAKVNNGATLELAGSVSALSSGTNRVNITNISIAAAGILVSGTHQVVGNIDGSGVTQVNAGSDLTADHIIQSALVIGGTAGSPALVTIDASDASGNPLNQSNGFALADSLTASGPFGDGVIGSASLSTVTTDSADPAAMASGNSVGGDNPAPVPEPSTLLLVLLAVLGIVSTQFARHRFRCQTVRSASP